MNLMRKSLAVLMCFVLFTCCGCIKITRIENTETSESSKNETKDESSQDSDIVVVDDPPVQLEPRQINENEDDPDFDEFIQWDFVDTIASDYMTMHFSLEHPENYGIDPSEVEVTIGSRPDDPEYFAAVRETLAMIKEEFDAFDREKLSAKQQDIYDLYAFMLDNSIKLSDEKFDYYEQLFSSMSGIHYNLATNFGEWELSSEEDAWNLCLLVEDTLPFIESCLNYTQIQMERGLLMVDTEEVISYCQGVVDAGMDSSILASMHEQIDSLDFDEDTVQYYYDHLDDAFEYYFLPAYQEIIDFMEAVPEEQNNRKGLAAFPNGKEYYELLLQEAAGTGRTVAETEMLLEEVVNDCWDQLLSLIMLDQEAYDVVDTGEEPRTALNSYEEILQMVSGRMFEDFPAISELDYCIENMPDDVASTSGVEAYFLIPKLDGEEQKQMRVNPAIEDIQTLGVFKTVAHEGYPGHMYQYAYMYENVESDYVKLLANIPAYSEGWAVYAAYEAYRYLDDINYSALQAMVIMEVLTYYSMLQMDIGIHYDGWDLEQFSAACAEMGFDLDEETAYMQYMQLQCNPAVFVPYYMGYYEFSAMRQTAVDALGTDFDPFAFHEALLQSGTMPFSVVWDHVNNYIYDTQYALQNKAS